MPNIFKYERYLKMCIFSSFEVPRKTLIYSLGAFLVLPMLILLLDIASYKTFLFLLKKLFLFQILSKNEWKYILCKKSIYIRNKKRIFIFKKAQEFNDYFFHRYLKYTDGNKEKPITKKELCYINGISEACLHIWKMTCVQI